ncbi:MAG: universal stress protein [Candidatus Melainabacteria bacterium]|nr:universal stress protein [Candidatus Melainabacteria bacterium]
MKVLLPVDIAHPHEDLAEHVSWILPLEGSEVKLLFVKELLPSYERLVSSMGDFPDDWTHQVDKKADSILTPLKERLEAAGATVTTEIASGPPEHIIATIAKDHAYDITVVAPGQHSNIEKFFLGSTSSSVVKLTPGTILVLRDHRGHDKLTHVVFGIDGTEESLHAIRTVTTQLQLAERNVKVTVLHAVAVPPLVAMFSPPEMSVNLEKNMEMEGEGFIAEALKVLQELGVMNAEPRQVQGEAAWELIRYAEHANAQLIVTGGGGKKFLEHALVGSAAIRTITHAKCSTAMVKLPKKARD